MIIRVKIFGFLRNCITFSSSPLQGDKLDIPEQATIDYVLELLNIPRNVSAMYLINGKHVKGESILSEGDFLHIIPSMTGG